MTASLLVGEGDIVRQGEGIVLCWGGREVFRRGGGMSLGKGVLMITIKRGKKAEWEGINSGADA